MNDLLNKQANNYDRGKAGEKWLADQAGNDAEREVSFPITEENGASFSRRADVTTRWDDGTIRADEVKTGKPWLTRNGQPAWNYMRLTDHLMDEIMKDNYLRETEPGYSPVWHFLGAHPDESLASTLDDYEIPWVTYYNYVPPR